MPSQQNVTLRARGLYSFPNTLSEVPDGALSEATNVVIDRDGVINPRRGFKVYGDSLGTSGTRSKQLLLYKDRILRHWTDVLDVDSDGAGDFEPMQFQGGGNAVVNEVQTGVRIKYVEANGNLYFTTSRGIYKISCLNVAEILSKPVTEAGGVKALDGYATLDPTPGWFTQDSIVAYRVVWGIKDDNSNVILGAPSERIIIANSLSTLLIQDYNDLVNDLAIVAAVPAILLTGDTHSNTTVDNITPDTDDLSPGMTITGAGIPASTLIVSVDSPSSITISNAATATTAGVSLTFDERLKDTDYATLKISLNSSAVTLYNALKALAYGPGNKLDNDIGGTTFQSITLTPPTEPSSPPTTGQLEQIQLYFDNIINELNITDGISTYAKTFIGDAFSNSSQSATVDLTFTIPEDITTAHFYQIYRSALFSSSGASTLDDIQPDDELRLVFEDNPTSSEIIARSVTFFDDIPETFRNGGANLYTNANSGEGIAQANTPPPLALDIASFKGSTFYANTSTLYNIQLALLTAVDLTNRRIYIVQGLTVNDYQFVNSTMQVVDITCIAGAAFTSSGTSDYFDIYSANNESIYRIWFQVGTSIAPSGVGVTLVQCTILAGDTSSQVAIKVANSLNTLGAFFAEPNSNIVTVTNEETGPANTPVENVANVGFAVSVTISGSGEDDANRKIGISNAPTPAQAVDETARSLVRVINKNATEIINAYYISGINDLPGLIRLEARNLGDPTFYVAPGDDIIATKFNPDLKDYTTLTAISVDSPTEITSVAHGLVTGDEIIIVGSNSTPSIDGVWIVTRIDNDIFTIPIAVTIAGTVGQWLKTENTIFANNEVVPNRIYYSKYQQPEAVPIVNYQDVGPKNKAILRILPLRDSLFIITEGGVYRLAGDTTVNFQISLFDSSTQLRAADSAVVLNNQIYMFSSQGIATISDTGISIISRPIENKLLPLTTSLYPTFNTATHAVSYESDRAYILFTVSDTTDVRATIAYRYNTFTNTWVDWDITKTCAVVNPDQDKLYMGAGDTNFIEVERKDFTRLDHADRQFDLLVPTGGISGTILSLGGNFNVEQGDVLVQTQYLTIAQLNRLLKYIDTDPGLTDKNYFSTLGAVAGTNLRASLTNLAAKLDADPGIVTPGFSAAISGFTDSFIDTQDAFNVIVNMLILDAGTFHKDYNESNGTVEYEVGVDAVNTQINAITLDYAAPLIPGPIIHYKKIRSLVVWAPHHFGDPSMLKQVSESTIIFENVAFSQAMAAYSSDLSTGFKSILIVGEGTGIWGGFDWGQVVWGGEGSSRPFRTYIPRDKQRCRYINGRWIHDAAFEEYSIFGISYTFSPISSRGYR